MRTLTIFRRAARRPILFAAVLLSTGCGVSNVVYAPGEAPAEIPPARTGYEDPDRYRIDPASAVSYTASMAFTPPLPREGTWVSKIPNARILPNEIWRATHKVGDRLLIFSPDYQERQCRDLLGYGKSSGAFRDPLSGRCSADYLYELIMSADGRVKGWLLLRNPANVALAKDRYANMDLRLREGPGWPEQPLFEQVPANWP